MELLIFLAVWVVCGVLAYGLTLYSFQTRFPEFRGSSDVALASGLGVMGPIGLLAAATGAATSKMPFGLQFIPKKPEPWSPYR